MDTTRTALWHPRQPAFFTVERLSRELFSPHRQDTRKKRWQSRVTVPHSALLSTRNSHSSEPPQLRSPSIISTLPPKTHLLCLSPKPSVSAPVSSGPSLVMHVAAPHHSLTRSRKSSLDRLQRPWVSLVEHDGDKPARSLRLLVTSSHWLWRSDTASPCFLCIGKRDVMQLFPNGSVQSLDVYYRGFDELTEGNAKF